MKRLISLLLAGTMAFGMLVTAYADRAKGDNYHLGVISGSVVDNSQNGGTTDLGSTTIGKNEIVKLICYVGYDSGSGFKPVLSTDKPNLTVQMRNVKGAAAIKRVEIKYDTSKRAYIALVLDEQMANTGELDFKATLNLYYNGKRISGPEHTVEGSLVHSTQDIYAGDTLIFAEQGRVMIGRGNVANCEIELNDDLSIFSRITSGRKYFAAVNTDIATDAAAEKLYDKYNDIVYYYEVKQVGFNITKVQFNTNSLDSNYHVYGLNSSGSLVYLGRVKDSVDFYNKYFISMRQLNISGTGTSTSSSSSYPSVAPSSQPTTTVSGTTLTTSSATSAGKTAAATARSQGLSTATVTLRSVEGASKEALLAMASGAGMAVRFNADVLNTAGSAVDIRLTLNPAATTKDLKLTASSYSAQANATKAFFEKWFRNKMLCISFAHQGSFGQTVQVAAKISTLGMDTTKLHFYSYNKATNTYVRITTPNYSIDANGFIHFSTTYGGDMMISEGALIRK